MRRFIDRSNLDQAGRREILAPRFQKLGRSNERPSSRMITGDPRYAKRCGRLMDWGLSPAMAKFNASHISEHIELHSRAMWWGKQRFPFASLRRHLLHIPHHPSQLEVTTTTTTTGSLQEQPFLFDSTIMRSQVLDRRSKKNMSDEQKFQDPRLQSGCTPSSIPCIISNRRR